MKRLSLLAVAVLFLAGLASAAVNISSPGSGSTVGSPVHFVATASMSRTPTHFNVYVDGVKVYGVDASKLDKYISVSGGKHTATVKAWDSTGASTSASVSFSVGTSATSSGTTTSSGSTFYDIEEMSGWNWCSACANAGGGAVLGFTQNISSPSQDGDATKFFLGGTTPWSHALYYKRLSSNSTATNFVYEVNYYYKTPSAPSGMEFSMSQRRGYQWYRMDTQCSYLNGNWRLWDNKNGHWVDTSIACPRPSAYKWTKVVFEGKRQDGQIVFVSITVNGNKHYLNRAFYPKQMSYSASSITVHFQLNGNATQTDYSVWGDNFRAHYW